MTSKFADEAGAQPTILAAASSGSAQDHADAFVRQAQRLFQTWPHQCPSTPADFGWQCAELAVHTWDLATALGRARFAAAWPSGRDAKIEVSGCGLDEEIGVPRSTMPLTVEIAPTPGSGPVSARLAGAVLGAIRDGRFRDGDVLPSTRSVAVSLGLARSAVVAAYEELAVGGFVRARPGSATVVAPGAQAAARAGRYPTLHVDADAAPTTPARRTPRYDLAPGYPDATLISSRAWDSAWRRAQDAARAATPYSMIVHGDTLRRNPLLRLRTQLADHLRRARGIACSPADVFVLPTTSAALAALVEVLGPAGRTVALEDPGPITTRRSLVSLGCSVRSYAVDGDGVSPAQLREEDLALVTPTHQHPLGVTMSSTRRVALLDWARRTGGLIVEDDHDGQFWHDVAPIPSLRSLDADGAHVVHLGMTHRLLSHELKLAWLVVPPRLRGAFDDYHLAHGNTVCEISANAFAEYVAAGSFTRHLARSSRVYTARRDAFVAACRRRLPGVNVLGTGAGLYVTLALDESIDDVALVHTLRSHGLECLPLSGFYDPASTTPRRAGLVCGYGRLAENLADGAVRVIAAALRSPTSRSSRQRS